MDQVIHAQQLAYVILILNQVQEIQYPYVGAMDAGSSRHDGVRVY